MKWTIVVLCALFFSCAIASDVLDLTDDTVEDAVKSHPFLLVEFFAPWCGHCKNLAPEYELAATALADSEIKLAKVDCIENAQACEKNGVQGYPTLIFFKNGQPKEYNGPRKADGIVEWLRSRSGPRVSQFKNEEELKAFTADKAGSTYLLGNYAADSEGGKLFSDLADHPDAEEWIFGQTTGDKNTITLHRPHGEDVVLDKDGSTIESILAWAAEHAYPYFGEIAAQYARMTKRAKPMVLVFVNDEDAEATKEIASWVEPIAKAKYSSLSFAHVGKQFHARLPQMGASGEVIPTVVVLDSQGRKWPFEDKTELNADNLNKFLDGILDGSVAPYFKSEAIPETNDEPVVVVVGKSFDSIVLDETKDVLVEFYAPWCGHCKKLVPVYNQVGEYFAGSKGVVIAKMDSAANDNSAVQISGFPTIYLFPAGKGAEPIQFNGDRTLEGFIQFVESNRKTDAEPELAEKHAAAAGKADDSDAAADHSHDEL